MTRLLLARSSDRIGRGDPGMMQGLLLLLLLSVMVVVVLVVEVFLVLKSCSIGWLIYQRLLLT